MRPALKKFTVSANQLTESMRELNLLADQLRQHFNDPRTYLTKVLPSREPSTGELLFDGEQLYLCVQGKYKAVQLVSPGMATVPDWFLEHLKIREEVLLASGVPRSDLAYYGGF